VNWKKSAPWLIIITISLVILDSVLKFLALNKLPEEGSLLHPGFLTLALHKNPGIAFDLRLSMPIILIFSIFIGLILTYVGFKNLKKQPQVAVYTFMIIIGALGNLFDRIVYGFTVDYILILGRSVINIADLIIVFGMVGLLISMNYQKEINSSG